MENFSFTQNSRVQKWVDTDPHEIYVYFALLLLMPLMKKHVLQDYWKQDPLIPTPIFPKFMTRDRFLLLTRFMHFADNGNPNSNDRIWKIRPFLSLVVGNFKRVFHPFQKIVIDESLILFKGRLILKQYIPSKRHRFGVKLFVLCDCETGIVLDIIVYTGTDVDIPKEDQGSGLGFSGAVVKKMMAPYMGHGHILYTDNWYSSPTLAQFLHDNATGTCGTVRESRKYMPKFNVPSTSYANPSDSDTPDEDETKTARTSHKAKKRRKPKAKTIQREATNKILAVKWIDRKPVTLLSTVHKGDMVDTGKVHYRTKKKICKPDVVADYNENMRLVDKSDCQLSGTECMRKSFKWYHKIVLHLIDIIMLNSYNIWLMKTSDPTCKKLKFREFIYNVSYQLLEDYGTVTNSRLGRRGHPPVEAPDRLHGAAYISYHHLQYTAFNEDQNRKNQLNCYVCANTSRRQKKRTRVTTICAECDVPLCPTDCFRAWHTQKNY
ncbi:piggyBac transposable element-derived protein 4-like [Macrobrachium rosenbergii]|uniref:piggyBac transposable element-derived protein 4-like n=1 Tax=Macrobrachium rosenbergii TaxID=79674 RepID=UPI0034D5BCAB